VVCAFAGEFISKAEAIKRITIAIDLTIFDLFSNIISPL
jgi:hypothetical protein